MSKRPSETEIHERSAKLARRVPDMPAPVRQDLAELPLEIWALVGSFVDADTAYASMATASQDFAGLLAERVREQWSKAYDARRAGITALVRDLGARHPELIDAVAPIAPLRTLLATGVRGVIFRAIARETLPGTLITRDDIPPAVETWLRDAGRWAWTETATADGAHGRPILELRQRLLDVEGPESQARNALTRLWIADDVVDFLTVIDPVAMTAEEIKVVVTALMNGRHFQRTPLVPLQQAHGALLRPLFDFWFTQRAGAAGATSTTQPDTLVACLHAMLVTATMAAPAVHAPTFTLLRYWHQRESLYLNPIAQWFHPVAYTSDRSWIRITTYDEETGENYAVLLVIDSLPPSRLSTLRDTLEAAPALVMTVYRIVTPPGLPFSQLDPDDHQDLARLAGAWCEDWPDVPVETHWWFDNPSAD